MASQFKIKDTSIALNESTNFINFNNLSFDKIELIIDRYNKIRFKDQVQYLNILMLDSSLPDILLSIIILLKYNNQILLTDFINLNEKNKVYNVYKLKTFIFHLLYSDVTKNKVWDGNTNNYKVFCYKENDELKYYSIYENKELVDLIFNRLYFKVIKEDNSVFLVFEINR